MADGGEQILYFAVVCGCVADAVGGEDWQPEGARDAEGGLIASFFFALLVALEFDVDVVGAEDADELFDCFTTCRFATTGERCGERAFVAASEAYESVCILGEVVES